MVVLILCCTMGHAMPGHQKHSYRGSKIQQEFTKTRVQLHVAVTESWGRRELLSDVDVEESITVWCSWSSSVPSPAIDTNHSADMNSGLGSLFRQKGPIVACSGEGLPAGACLAIARQVRYSASYRRRDRVHLGLPPFLQPKTNIDPGSSSFCAKLFSCQYMRRFEIRLNVLTQPCLLQAGLTAGVGVMHCRCPTPQR